MANGDVKVQRIQRKNQVLMGMFRDILRPEVLHTAVPRLGEAAEERRIHRSIMDEATALGKYCRINGFDPTRTFQHVAQIDVSVWSAILEVFGKFDYESGELRDDGLLYVKDANGTIKLNKDFFYSLISFLQSSGYECDMRGKIKLT
jgi:hypothetical protein